MEEFSLHEGGEARTREESGALRGEGRLQGLRKGRVTRRSGSSARRSWFFVATTKRSGSNRLVGTEKEDASQPCRVDDLQDLP